MRLTRRLLWTTMLLALGAVAPCGLHAQNSSDAAAKARLVLAFARFVHWPARAAPADPILRLCVLQASASVSSAFYALAGSDVGGRRLEVTVDRVLPHAAECQLLFVDSSAARVSAATLAAAAAQATLTMGSREGFLAQGGMVEIVLVDDTLRFDVDLSTLRNASLSVNPGVLKLARQVRQ